ncbi:helicase associated domain-containing protein, partial [Acidithiobacillus ferriphilus]
LETVPGWVWNVWDDTWTQGLTALRAFVEREGHTKVHDKHVEPDGFKLGNWVGSRRYDYRQGILSAERIAELEAVPGWVWGARADAWKQGLDALRTFVAREGHATIPKRHVEPDGFKLGSWVRNRRQEFRIGRMSAERIAELEAVPGWVWSIDSVSSTKGPKP